MFEQRDEINYGRGIAAGSIFLGMDTIIGPVYEGHGVDEGGQDNYLLLLGAVV